MTMRRILGFPAVALFLASVAAAQDGDLDLLEQEAFRAAVGRVAPTIVCIETIGGLDRVGETLFGSGPTTGLVVTPDGCILSSAYNFLNKPASILVQLPGGVRKPAELVATDLNRMLALLKVEPDDPLPVPPIAPVSELRVGQWAIAVGRGYESDRPNMAVGVISATNRIWGKAIQTDAAVSPSNYGGPLVDIRGRVMGILVPLSPEGNQPIAGVEWYDSGIGFAIPAEEALAILPRLQSGKDLHPGLTGLGFGTADSFTAAPAVVNVRPGSPAYEAGLKAGDKIVEVDGRPVLRIADVKVALSRRYAGDSVRVSVRRGDEQIEKEFSLVAELQPYAHPLLGVLPLRSGGEKSGVAIRFIYPDSPAEKSGLKPGDVITSAGGTQVGDAAALRSLLDQHKPDESLEIAYLRDGAAQKADIVLARLPDEAPGGPLPPADADQNAEPAAAGSEKPAPTGLVQLKAREFPNESWVYVPENYRREIPHGLVVWLDATDGFDRDALVAQWKEHCRRDRLILLLPRPAADEGWEGPDVELVSGLVTQLERSYTLDPARIVVGGQREGGTLACLVAFRNRQRFTGLVPVDAELPRRLPENEPSYRLAFFAARSAERAERLDAAVERLRAMKYPVAVRELGEKSRGLSVEEVGELARWVDCLDRL